MPRAEGVDATFPRLPLKGRCAAHLAECGRKLLEGPEKLDDYPLWDSTAIITFMALADEHNGCRLTPRQIAACQTVDDLLQLAKVET